jgi:ankyrin repeat protein
MVKKKKVEEEPAEPAVAKLDSDIHKLAAHGQMELIKTLVEAEDSAVDISVPDNLMCTPLVLAARGGHIDVVAYFIEMGADIESPSYGGMRALHHAANQMKEVMITKLIEAGADVAAPDDKGNTALHYAAARGAISQCTLLIDAGGDISSANNNGSTPVMKACMNGQFQALEFFVKVKADVTKDIDSDGNTALHHAAQGGFPKLADVLTGAGAAKDVKNKAGKTADDLMPDAFKVDFGGSLTVG